MSVAYPEKRKQIAEEMFKEMKQTFRTILESADWIDGTTRTDALKKLTAMVSHLGYPDWLLNNFCEHFKEYGA